MQSCIAFLSTIDQKKIANREDCLLFGSMGDRKRKVYNTNIVNSGLELGFVSFLIFINMPSPWPRSFLFLEFNIFTRHLMKLTFFCLGKDLKIVPSSWIKQDLFSLKIPLPMATNLGMGFSYKASH